MTESQAVKYRARDDHPNVHPVEAATQTKWMYFLLGCAILLPFNALFNATSFFLSRLAGSPYYPTFSSYLSTTYTWTKLVCQFYCTFTLKQSSPSRRILVSITAMILLITTLYSSTFVRGAPSTFFAFTLVTAACTAVASSYLCTSAYAGAALIGAPCLRALLSGQATIAVAVSAVQVASSAIAIWDPSSKSVPPKFGDRDNQAEEIAARIFFATAALFLFIALIVYAWSTRQSSRKSSCAAFEHQRAVGAPDESTALLVGDHRNPLAGSNSHIFQVFGNNLIFMFSIAHTYTVTLAVYPAVTARVRPVNPSFHPLLFTAVHFLVINTGSFVGQYTCSFPRLVPSSGKKILTMSLLRTLFIPLFLLCNIDRPGTTTTVPIIRSDMLFMVIVFLGGYTNGYVMAAALLAVSSLEHNPRLKGREDVDVVATLGSSCMILGLALGALSSFGVQALISRVELLSESRTKLLSTKSSFNVVGGMPISQEYDKCAPSGRPSDSGVPHPRRKHDNRRQKRSFASTTHAATSTSTTNDLPLSGIRVLELGQLIAGPFCGQLLGHFGAEIIKIEPPLGGDPLRAWRELDVDGVSPWFRSLGRNKKSVAIDLRQEEGRVLVKQLATKSDVIIENFKPGTLEKWGLGPSALHPLNPFLIYTRVSGYGQTGPWSSRPGYASVCEAESGFRYINGFVNQGTNSLSGPPVRPNISLGDSVAGLHAAFGTVLALLSKQKKTFKGEQSGQTVDVSIMESMLNLMEGIIPEYDRKGKVRGPSGSSVTGIVPTNAYPCLPSPTTPSTPAYIIIGANGDTLYARLMRAIGREDLIGPNYAHNQHRVVRQAEIEEAISDWTRTRTAEEVLDVLDGAGVPVGRVVGVKEIMENEHVKARGAVEDVWVGEKDDGWNVKMPGVFPVLEGSGARTRWAGPELGEHTDDVLARELGLDTKELARFRERGIIR